MPSSLFKFVRNPFHWRAWEKGSGMLEFVITLPVWALFVLVMAYFIALYYRHLATLSTAGDCVVMQTQSGTTQAFASSHQVRDAYGLSAVVGVATRQCSASTEGPRGVWGGSQSIHYDFIFPLQPYRSDWIRGLP